MEFTKINKKVIILISITSDIGTALAKRYSNEGNIIIGTYKSTDKLKELKKIANCHLFFCDLTNKESILKFIKDYKKLDLEWDIFISCPATLNPIGNFFDCDFNEWDKSIHINAIEQLRILQRLYPYRNKNLINRVVFFAGGGTNSAPKNFSAYTISKIILIKMCELLDTENKDLNIFIIGPGWVKTKIHNETIKAGKKAGLSYDKTINFLKLNKGTNMDDIYDCINLISRQEKRIVSGRNFSIINDKCRKFLNGRLIRELISDKEMYKLRRHKNDFLKWVKRTKK